MAKEDEARSTARRPRANRAALGVGWFAIGLVTTVSGWWAFWGINEAFHEGWCHPQLWVRLLQVLAYLGATIVLSTLSCLGIRWPRVGATLFILTGVVIAALMIWDGAYFGATITAMLTGIPCLVGLLFLFGRPAPKLAAYAVSAGIPLLIVIGFGAEPVIRVNSRFDDGDRGARLVAGNGVTLLWAPEGPGWTRRGTVSWEEAVRRARHLTADGASLAEEPQDIWRLPTCDEVVRSMTRSGQNAGGELEAPSKRVRYKVRPDKESPLWDPYAPLIYLWTSEEESRQRAWIVVYHGGVFAKPKNVGSPSFGFRAVRQPPEGGPPPPGAPQSAPQSAAHSKSLPDERT
jgi:hypothetical protein